MKSIRLFYILTWAAFAACSNMPPEDSVPFKAYPNPYNPSAGVLTIEKTSGTYSTTDQHDLVILNYNLGEIYRANVTPGGTGKITWTGIDSSGSKVAPGIYYIKLIVSKSTGVEGADALFKLVVQ